MLYSNVTEEKERRRITTDTLFFFLLVLAIFEVVVNVCNVFLYCFSSGDTCASKVARHVGLPIESFNNREILLSRNTGIFL